MSGLSDLGHSSQRAVEPRESSIPGVPEGSLLAKRLAWEAENPRPAQLVEAERAIVVALRDSGFGTQHQVTRRDGFDIAVDDLIVRVEHHPETE